MLGNERGRGAGNWQGVKRLLNNVIKVATKCIKRASNVGSKAKRGLKAKQKSIRL